MHYLSKLTKAATVGMAAAAATKRGLDSLDDAGSGLAEAASRARRIVVDIVEETPDLPSSDGDGDGGSTLLRTVVVLGAAGAAWRVVSAVRRASDDPVALVKDSVGAVSSALAGASDADGVADAASAAVDAVTPGEQPTDGVDADDGSRADDEGDPAAAATEADVEEDDGDRED